MIQFRLQLIDENLKLMNLPPMARMSKVGEMISVSGFNGTVKKIKRDVAVRITYIYAER